MGPWFQTLNSLLWAECLHLPQLICWNTRGLCKVTRIKWIIGVELTEKWKQCPYKSHKRAWFLSLSSSPWRHNEKVAVRKPEGVLHKSWTTRHLVSDLRPPEQWEMSFCSLSTTQSTEFLYRAQRAKTALTWLVKYGRGHVTHHTHGGEDRNKVIT